MSGITAFSFGRITVSCLQGESLVLRRYKLPNLFSSPSVRVGAWAGGDETVVSTCPLWFPSFLTELSEGGSITGHITELETEAQRGERG